MTQQDDPLAHTNQDRPLTYYDILDLDRDATAEEIKAAYYELARKYHPDVAGDDAVAAQRFALINEAYHVLSDPQRRYQYDRTLPRKSYPLRHPTPEKVWREATDVVLIRSDRFGPLNQAMQAAVPITLDGDLLVLTMPGSERHLAGHLETASNRNAILNALELVIGRRINFRVIDGTTVEDWEQIKAAEEQQRKWAAQEKAEAPSPAAPAAGPAAAGSDPWNQIIQQMHRRYHELSRRQQPQAKARFCREILIRVIQTEEEIRAGGEVDEDTHERNLARMLDRLATVLEVPGVVVGLEFERMKRTGDY